MAKQQKVQGSERETGTRDESYNLISALYHLLKGASNAEQYIRDAQEAGDQELVQFFKDWQDEQRNLSERAKNLLGSRVGGGVKAGIGRQGAERGQATGTPVRDVTNASVRSGGNARDDIVDEQSKESFPASDAPAKY